MTFQDGRTGRRMATPYGFFIHMQLSDWFAAGALVISLISGAFTIFYSRTQHRLNKAQLADRDRDSSERKLVTLRAELIELGPQTFLRTTNIGRGTAKAVTVDCRRPDGGDGGPLLESEDISLVTPVHRLTPGEYFEIRATRWFGMVGPQPIVYHWNDEDGVFCETTLKVHV